MDLGKWNVSRWHRVTRYLQVFDTSLVSKLRYVIKVVFPGVDGWSTRPPSLGMSHDYN